ncbi:MAG: LysM peptidoglycan-binding domain-containing protein [Anaerolineales bacterium]|nr:LysM peptidoglycan-binding domain-containing protein [Anaerolineales bacterium]
MDSDPDPELAQNLEWLLQSGEQELEFLTELLTLLCAPLLLDLGDKLGLSPPQSERLTVEAIAACGLNISAFRATQSARSWIVRQYLEVVSAADLSGSLDEETQTTRRRPGTRSWGITAARRLMQDYSWTANEAAQACGIDVANLPAYKAPLKESKPADHPDRQFPALPEISEERLASIAWQAARRASRGLFQRQMADRLREVVAVGAAILLAVVVFWMATRLVREEAQTSIGAVPLVKPTLIRGPTPTSLWAENVSYVIHSGDTLSSIASLSGMSLEELRKLNGIQGSYTPRQGVSLWVRVPDKAPDNAPPSLLPNLSQIQPLDSSSSLTEIRARMLEGRKYWRTLQAEYQLVTYLSKQQAKDSARFYRFQVWVSQPYFSNELFGGLDELPNIRHIIRSGRNYNQYGLNQTAGFSGAYLDLRWRQPPGVLVYSPVLREMIFPQANLLIDDSGKTAVIGLDQIAGRPCVQIEWRSPDGRVSYQYCVDAASGILLRRQTLDRQRGFMTADMTATLVQFDVPITEDVFDPRVPWHGG